MDIKKFKDGDSGKDVRQTIETNFNNLNEFKAGYQDKVDGPDGKSSILRALPPKLIKTCTNRIWRNTPPNYCTRLSYRP